MEKAKEIYRPSFKGVVISHYDDLVKKSDLSLISLHDVSNRTLVGLGLNTKESNLANTSSEEQEAFVIVFMGLRVDKDEFKIGDKILVRAAVQPMSFTVNGKIYYQIHEHEIAGVLS